MSYFVLYQLRGVPPPSPTTPPYTSGSSSICTNLAHNTYYTYTGGGEGIGEGGGGKYCPKSAIFIYRLRNICAYCRKSKIKVKKNMVAFNLSTTELLLDYAEIIRKKNQHASISEVFNNALRRYAEELKLWGVLENDSKSK